MLASAYEIFPASIAPLISSGMGIDRSIVSWLVSAMFAVAIPLSLPAGRYIDQIGSRRAIVMATSLFGLAGVGSWYFASIGAYAPLLIARIVAGGGYILLWNAGLNAFGEFENRATSMSLFAASGPFGFAVGQLTAPLLAVGAGWSSPFLVYPALMIVPGLTLLSTTVPNSKNPDTPRFDEVHRLLANGPLLLICVMGFVSYSLYLFVNTWLPSYLDTELGYTVVQSGALVAVFPLLGAFSRVSGGVIADRLFGGRRRPILLCSFLVSGPLVASFLVVRRMALLLVVLFVTGYLIQLSIGLFYSYVPELVDARFVTAAIAFLSAIGLSGAFLTPIVASLLVQHFDRYTIAFAYAICLAALGTILVVMFNEH
ncbi:MFS transporter [Halobacterium noricense]